MKTIPAVVSAFGGDLSVFTTLKPNTLAETPWFLQTWDLFGLLGVPIILIIIVGAILLVGIAYFIISGYLKEVKSQKKKAAKAKKKGK
ncbi:MAG: hypothetical protein LBU61_01450 [Coriobacteriales bacterium]|jgi:hypothetical protein|nr:hypothetical protein [Coriobacteriales bacterium]